MDADPDPEPGRRAGESNRADTGLQVTGIDRTRAGFDDLDRLVALARRTLAAEGVRTGELDLVAVDVEEMADLNATHMGHDGPTDVLSFPLDADDVLAGLAADDPPHHTTHKLCRGNRLRDHHRLRLCKHCPSRSLQRRNASVRLQG